MAVKTILEVVQAVAGELALPIPSIVMQNATKTISQLKSLVIGACDDLADMHDWQALVKTGTFTTISGQPGYALPADCLRLIPSTEWDRTNTKAMAGSQTSEQWSNLTNQTPGAYTRYRVVGGKLILFPTPGSTPTSVTFDYITRNYVMDVGLGTLKSNFTQDSDVTVFADRCLINFVKLKWTQENGLNTQAAVENFNTSLAAAKSSDVPPPKIYLNRAWGVHYLDETNLPYGGWGQ
jgi:hypothetical protein